MFWKIWSRLRPRNPQLTALNIWPAPRLDPLSPFYFSGPHVRSLDPYPENAPGPFYVQRHECIACGVPKTVAPDLVEFDAETMDHCYFKKQPTSPDEIFLAIRAVEVCCCGSYRYSGDDEEIKKRLKKAGCVDAIDRS